MEEVPPTAQMYLVYFDQNYEGGGLTASYKVAGQFEFTVPTSLGPQTAKVNIPWSWPSDPYRVGYTFSGWSLSPTGTPVSNIWTPTAAVTTLYGIWVPNTYTLTWDANTGTGGGNTTQG